MKITHNKVGQNLNLSDAVRPDAGKSDAAKANGKLGDKLGETASAKSAGATAVASALGKNGVAPANLSSSRDSARVNVSDRAMEAKKIKELAMATPDVDEAKVAKFKKMVDEGTYKVDAKAVADRMVDEHLGMSGMNNDDE